MPNNIVHFEIGCRDTDSAAKFYGALFDWKPRSEGAIATVGTHEGISGHIGSLGHDWTATTPSSPVTLNISLHHALNNVSRIVLTGKQRNDLQRSRKLAENREQG
jgi:predicted enzyme related to lactoylglutathione lyase